MIDRRWWHYIQVALGLVVLGLALRSLAGQWEAFRTQEIAWRIAPGWLLAAVTVVWLSYALLVEGWRRVVVAMDQRLAYWPAVRICMVSNLGKYLPGKVWAIAGAALMAERAGVEPGAAVASAFILQGLALASGLLLVAGLAPEAVVALGSAARIALVVLAIVAIAGLLVLSLPPLFDRVRRWLPGPVASVRAVPLPTMLVALGANLIAWSAYGLAFLCLIRGLTPDAAVGWSQATAVFTTSYLVGLIAAFAPGGIGPREFAFVLLLSPSLGPKLAVALAVATRLLLTITELGAAAPFLPSFRRTARSS